MPKKKREYQNVWEWLLNMGIVKATILLVTIDVICLIACMSVLQWLIKKGAD